MDEESTTKEDGMSHVYVPDFDKAAEEDGDILFVPCKLCGKGPGGDHRSFVAVTTWSANKLHLAVPAATRTICNQGVVTPGRMSVIGTTTQERIDSLPPCKKCAKRRETLERNGER